MNKIKKMYMEWKEVVNLVAFVITAATALLVVDTMPTLAMAIVLLLVCIGLATYAEG